jgi:class 3 adenylate cyclase
MDTPETRYAKTHDGVHIAYQTLGDGPVDVLTMSYFNISVDAFDREPHFRRFTERLTRFARLIRFDGRGIGLSDPVALDAVPSIERNVEDALAVLDAAGSSRAALLGVVGSSPVMILLAATHPERAGALILLNGSARSTPAPDYPHGLPEEFTRGYDDDAVETTEVFNRDFVAVQAPSLAADPAFREWWNVEGRRGASPAVARLLNRMRLRADVRSALASIHVPTLVMHRKDNPLSQGMGDYLADHIPGARCVHLAGEDPYPFGQDLDTITEEIEEFLTGARHHHEPDRVLATILFTDLVSSTQRATAMGDRAWRELLDRHDDMVRRQIERFGGREIKATGDGFLAVFDGSARAVRAAAAIRDGAEQLGVEVRAGVHAGEVELRGNDIGGIAVHVGQRVSALAGAGEVLVSSTVVDLVAGSGLEFEDRGEHELKGVGRPWRVYMVKS